MTLYEGEELTEIEKIAWIEQYLYEIASYRKEIYKLDERKKPYIEEIELLNKKLAAVNEIVVKK